MAGIGAEIKRRREELDLSQPRLAVKAGVAVSAVSQIENGKRSPNLGTLEKIAGALGVEVVDLFPKAQAPLPFEEPLKEGALEERRARAYLSAFPSGEERTQDLKKVLEMINGYTDRWRTEVEEIEDRGTFPYGRGIEMYTMWEKFSDAMENAGVTDYVGWIETGRLDASDKERKAAIKILDGLIGMRHVVVGMREVERRNRERAGEEAKDLVDLETAFARTAAGEGATTRGLRKHRGALGLG